MRSAVRPAFPNCAESAMEKHPACAAASNSSGFVPIPFSNRVENEYCVSFKTPLALETVPFPSFRPPVQTALPFRIMIPPWISLHPNPTKSYACASGSVARILANLFCRFVRITRDTFYSRRAHASQPALDRDSVIRLHSLFVCCGYGAEGLQIPG